MKMRSVVLASAVTLLLTGTAAPQEKGLQSCFVSRDFGNWKAADNSMLYIRVRTHRVFRVDLAGPCPLLTWPGAILVSKFHGIDTICHPSDWDLQVATDLHDAPHSCIVKQMTELTPAEIDALPRHLKP